MDGLLEVESDVEFGRRFTLDLVEHEFHAGILKELVGGVGEGLASDWVEDLEHLCLALLRQLAPRILEETAGGLGDFLPQGVAGEARVAGQEGREHSLWVHDLSRLGIHEVGG